MAACLQAGSEAVVSHRSAAAIWGLEGFEPPSTVDLSVPHDRRPRVERARVHRREMPRRTFRDGIPVTPIPETILDLCAVSTNPGIPLRALDDVRRRSLVSTFELTRCAADHSERRTAGIPLYRSLLEKRLGRTPPGTAFAAQVLDLLVAAGLPEPEAEFRVVIDGRSRTGGCGTAPMLSWRRWRRRWRAGVVSEGATMAGMTFCARCGGELPVAARFCPACGRPTEPDFGPPAPPKVRPMLADVRLPDWATADWPLVGLGVALMLVVLFAVSAVYGLVTASAVAGDIAAAPCGAVVGAHLAFTAFGARTFAGCGLEHGSALATGFLALPWALVGGLAVEAARRFAWRRLPNDPSRRVGYAWKLALAFGVALGIIAGLVARGDPARRGSSFASSLNGGEIWFYATCLSLFWAWIALRREGLRPLAVRQRRPGGGGDDERGDRAGAVRRFRRGAWEGAMAFGALVGGLAIVGLFVALVVADEGYERIGLVLGFPVVGLSFGVALVDGAMGAALGGAGGHTSLTHFGLPAGPGAGAAPPWLFAALLLAPAAVAATVWRRLERERPADEQGALAVGAASGLGFAVTAWVAALVSRILILASVSRATTESLHAPQIVGRLRSTVGAFVAARPNPAAVLGLALFWGLAGGLGAAFLWASRHRARWQVAGRPAAPGDAAAPPPAAGSAWLLPETPPTPVPPPEPPAGPAQADGPVGGGESTELGVEPPGENP